ncbi:MAG: hypothetical protein EHM70_22625 [Chloroflexota bacterium]|nr:MAG: hypothetical protein EHM70_22625 [Chloroflexota bacterium]
MKCLYIALIVALLLSACSAPQPGVPTPTPFNVASAFPTSGSQTGWTVYENLATYNRDNLFNLVDGQAESFFVYGFEQVTVQRYQKEETHLNLEIWQLATPADAFGLFSAGRTGEPASIGVEGNTDPGRRLAFWQNRYFVSLTADQQLPDEELWAFGRAVSGALPAGGETPGVVASLPAGNKVERSEIFFHEEMSVQMEVWLGGENLLGLSQQTNAVLARYEFGEQTVRLMLVEYPAAGEANDALAVLQSGKVEDILASGAKDNLLAAVIGKAEASAVAGELLGNTLK